MAIAPTTHDDVGQVPPDEGSSPARARHVGWVVAGSLATGLVAALLLVAAPFVPAEEADITGAVLCGFALGWAMLAVLSVRFTDQPQAWAAVPAAFMGLGGLLLLLFGSSVDPVLSWVWPPGLAGAGCLDGRAGPPAPSEPEPTLAALPGVRDARRGRGGRRLRDPAAQPPMPDLRCPVSRSMSVDTPCTCTAPAPAAPPSCCSPGVARCPRTWAGSRPGSPPTPASASTTARVAGGANPSDTAQDASQIATDLHTLLQRGERPRPLRAGRPLLRWAVRAHLRRPLPGRGRRDGRRGHHRTARDTACRRHPTTRTVTTPWDGPPP